MVGLCWMAVVLTLFLSAGNSLAAVDQTWLANIVKGIKDQYALGNTFSLAVNIPENQDPNSLQQVLQDDSADKVKQTVSQGQVYQSSRVVAAAQADALSRVLENIQPFIKSSQGNFLIIYSEESPCGSTCTNTNVDSIASRINDVTQNWSGYAFVFSKVTVGPEADTSQLAQSFKQLTVSKLGLENIFRCYQPGNDPFQCTSCSSGGDVTPSCVADTSPSNQESAAEETGTPKPAGVGEQVPKSTGEGIGTGSRGRRRGMRRSRRRGRGRSVRRGRGRGRRRSMRRGRGRSRRGGRRRSRRGGRRRSRRWGE